MSFITRLFMCTADNEKRPVARTADLFVVSYTPHGLATHDLFNPEQRHQYAKLRIVILLLFCYSGCKDMVFL